MGVEEVKGDTITPRSISTAGQTFVSVERILLPTKIGVADVAMTVGRARGTPGALETWVTGRRLCRWSCTLRVPLRPRRQLAHSARLVEERLAPRSDCAPLRSRQRIDAPF